MEGPPRLQPERMAAPRPGELSAAIQDAAAGLGDIDTVLVSAQLRAGLRRVRSSATFMNVQAVLDPRGVRCYPALTAPDPRQLETLAECAMACLGSLIRALNPTDPDALRARPRA